MTSTIKSLRYMLQFKRTVKASLKKVNNKSYDLEYTEDDPFYKNQMRPKFLKGGKKHV